LNAEQQQQQQQQLLLQAQLELVLSKVLVVRYYSIRADGPYTNNRQGLSSS
jgi:hypothetical protein